MIVVLLWLYRLSLRSYPRTFRAQFGDELVEVFGELLARRAGEGRWRLLATGFQELYHLPLVLLRLHWRAWHQCHSGRLFLRVADVI